MLRKLLVSYATLSNLFATLFTFQCNTVSSCSKSFAPHFLSLSSVATFSLNGTDWWRVYWRCWSLMLSAEIVLWSMVLSVKNRHLQSSRSGTQYYVARLASDTYLSILANGFTIHKAILHNIFPEHRQALYKGDGEETFFHTNKMNLNSKHFYWNF